ncbi:MAG TPA: hypothetical protein VIM58_02735 [Candidatus Methylacidiphilales bacterium]
MTTQSELQVETLALGPLGWVPNNARLPVLVYRGALPGGAGAIEKAFERNGWPPEWRGGIYDFDHYHSTTHEALGVAHGRARLRLGGPEGEEVDVAAGDVLVLPVGTGHCRIEEAEGFLVVGAYPPGHEWDLLREAPDAEARERMARLPVPETDPVAGKDGPLVRLWK